MSWLQPFYGGTASGQSFARFLNRLLLLLELGFIVWHITVITDFFSYSPHWVFWVVYPFLVLIAMMIIGCVFSFLCRIYLAIKYGATNPSEVEVLGYQRDARRAQRIQAKAARESAKKDTWKEDDPGPGENDPYNIERNRDIFRKL